MKLSVIVPVYNVGASLSPCLESLKKQAGNHEAEFILVDDGSTDDSGRLCDEFSAADSRFRVIHQANAGVAQARNAGLDAASGDWVAFVDGDDELEAGFLENLREQEYSNADLVFFRWGNRFPSGETVPGGPEFASGPLQPEAAEELQKIILNADLLKTSQIIPQGAAVSAPWAKLYRRRFLEDHALRFTPGLKIGEDNVFNFRVYQAGPRCFAENLPAYLYRRSDASTMSRYTADAADRYDAFYQALEQALPADSPLRAELPLRAVRNFLVVCAQDFFHPGNPKPTKARKKEFKALRNRDPYREAFRKADLSKLRPSVRVGAELCKYQQFGLYRLAWKLSERMGVSHA